MPTSRRSLLALLAASCALGAACRGGGGRAFYTVLERFAPPHAELSEDAA